MTFLLDVNVLIALLDPMHVRHQDAYRWFEAEARDSWATCPIVQNGVLRIMGGPKYPDGAGSPGPLFPILAEWLDREGHQFWPDDLSLLTATHVDVSQIRTSAQMTDTYLLALAVARGGKLATFDRRLSPAAVRGGKPALHLVG